MTASAALRRHSRRPSIRLPSTCLVQVTILSTQSCTNTDVDTHQVWPGLSFVSELTVLLHITVPGCRPAARPAPKTLHGLKWLTSEQRILKHRRCNIRVILTKHRPGACMEEPQAWCKGSHRQGEVNVHGRAPGKRRCLTAADRAPWTASLTTMVMPPQPVVRQQYLSVYGIHRNSAVACAPVEIIASHGSAERHGQVCVRVDAPWHDEQACCVDDSRALRRLHSAKATVMRPTSHRQTTGKNIDSWLGSSDGASCQGLTWSDGATAVMRPPSKSTSALKARSALTTVPPCQHWASD